LIELKEAEEKSLKESERLEKEIAEVQELKVIDITSYILQFFIRLLKNLTLFHRKSSVP